MHGNVWEWQEDDYHGDYVCAPTDGSAWVDKPRGTERVLRGGSWMNTPDLSGSAYRFKYLPGIKYKAIGFRLVAELRPKGR